MIVPHLRTPIPMSALAGIVDAGYHAAIGTCPGLDALAVLLAQLVQEHGLTKNDDAGELLWSVWNFNLGNVDALPVEIADPSVAIFRTVRECEGPACSSRWVHTRRAWDTAESGAEAFVRALRERFEGAFHAASVGPFRFVDELKAAKYFTGDVVAYRAGVAWLARQAARVWIPAWKG